MNEAAGASALIDAGAIFNTAVPSGAEAPALSYRIECRSADGALKWAEEIHNLVTTQGKNSLVDNHFKGVAYTAAWFLGLKGTGTVSSGDTLASHTGWSEVSPYSGNRPAVAWGTTSGGANTATQISIPITSSATVAGAFLASAATGTSGVLYSVADFAASRTVASGDTMNITPTVSIS